MNSYIKGNYKVVCFMRIDEGDDGDEETSLHEAEKELAHWEFMMPENIYQIERIHGTK